MRRQVTPEVIPPHGLAADPTRFVFRRDAVPKRVIPVFGPQVSVHTAPDPVGLGAERAVQRIILCVLSVLSRGK